MSKTYVTQKLLALSKMLNFGSFFLLLKSHHYQNTVQMRRKKRFAQDLQKRLNESSFVMVIFVILKCKSNLSLLINPYFHSFDWLLQVLVMNFAIFFLASVDSKFVYKFHQFLIFTPQKTAGRINKFQDVSVFLIKKIIERTGMP